MKMETKSDEKLVIELSRAEHDYATAEGLDGSQWERIDVARTALLARARTAMLARLSALRAVAEAAREVRHKHKCCGVCDDLKDALRALDGGT